MAITISGSGITSANIADGTITTDDIASGVTGKVLQVVQAIDSSSSLGNNTSPVSVMTASITPSSTSSKVLCMVSAPVYGWDNNNLTYTWRVYNRLYRGTTSGTSLFTGNTYNSQTDGASHISINYLDSPSTTSSQTYTFALWVADTPEYWAFPSNANTTPPQADATIILMEIAG